MIYNCDRCGRPGAKIIDENQILCSVCYDAYNSCLACGLNKKCEFEFNPAPIPKFVKSRAVHQTPHGVVEQIIQTVNPQRAKAFCIETECDCLKKDVDGKYRCMRQFGVCEKYQEIKL